jgi:hypothetical protein
MFMEQAGEIANQANAKYNAMSVEAGSAKLTQGRLDLELNPDYGFKQQKGDINRPGFYKDYQDRYDLMAKGVMDSAPNDQVRQMLAQHVAMQKQQFAAPLLNHMADESNQYAADAYHGGVQSTLQDQAAHPEDGDLFNANVTKLKGLAQNFVDHRYPQGGAPDGYLESLTGQNLSAISYARIQATLDRVSSDPTALVAAKGMLQDYRGMLGEKYAPALKLFSNEATAVDSKSDGHSAYIGALQEATKTLGHLPTTSADMEGLEGAVQTQAETIAKQNTDHAGDPDYVDRVSREAIGLWTRDLHVMRSGEESRFQQVWSYVRDHNAMSEGDLPSQVRSMLDQLPVSHQASIDSKLEHNQRLAERGETMRSDPRVFNSAEARLTLPAGDPNRLSTVSDLIPLIGHGLNDQGFERLARVQAIINDPNKPAEAAFQKEVNEVKKTAAKMLSGSQVGNDNPDIAAEAAYRFGTDVEGKIAAAQAAKKPTDSLFDPKSNDYVLDPSRVARFMPNENEVAKYKADLLKPPANAPQHRPGESPADFLKRVHGSP